MNIDDLALVCSVLVGISGSYWHQKFGRRWRILLAKTCYLVAVSTCRTMSPATQQRCSVIISIIASGAITLWIENTLWCFWTFRLTRGSELVDPCSINCIILWMIVTLLWSIWDREGFVFVGRYLTGRFWFITHRLYDCLTGFFDVWAGWTRVN